MADVTFITVGTLKEGYLKEAIAEYKKRITQYARVEEVELKEERISDEDNSREVSAALEREADKILSAVPKGAEIVALCVEGKEMDSPALARYIGEAVNRCGKLAFIIGSSHGLSPRVKSAAALRLSFSRLTFPHQLMRVNLYEAVYRSFTILAGKKYHK